MKRLLQLRWRLGWFRRMAPWIARHAPSCSEMARWSSQAAERRLSLRERLLRLVHFVICDWCFRYAVQLRFLRQATRRLAAEGEPHAHHRLSPEARDRLKRRLAEPPAS